MATGQISRRSRFVASDLSVPSSRCSRFCWRKRRGASGESRRRSLRRRGRGSVWFGGGSMATGQISRRRRLVASDLAGENTKVLRESEGEEASAAAEVEVFGLEEDPWPPDRSLGAVVSLHQISRRRRVIAADLAGENAEVLRESEGEEAFAAAEEEMFGLEESEGNLLLYSV
ncbi:uncharacterized protein G2W53_015126 [Senna tora]|uniref:Uncharacterized protein n=1 Tax=Senna tora TaxID=362788 RepID=A0A834WUF8_9FABA|nr:uncharacterized protein G2W53_015126 [Senna tora]